MKRLIMLMVLAVSFATAQEYWSFTTGTLRAPAQIQILEPAHGDTVVSNWVTIKFEADNFSELYWLQVSLYPDFLFQNAFSVVYERIFGFNEQSLIDYPDLDITILDPIEAGTIIEYTIDNLRFDTTYYIRIRGRNEAGWGDWSTVNF
jgi:hypothetical protein